MHNWRCVVQRLFSLFPAEAAGYGPDPAGMLLRNLKSAAHPPWEIVALFIVVALLSFGVYRRTGFTILEFE